MDIVYIGHEYFLSLGINDLICVTFCVRACSLCQKVPQDVKA